jgi:hypothetical protein
VEAGARHTGGVMDFFFYGTVILLLWAATQPAEPPALSAEIIEILEELDKEFPAALAVAPRPAPAGLHMVRHAYLPPGVSRIDEALGLVFLRDGRVISTEAWEDGTR